MSAPIALWQALWWRPDWVLVLAPTFFCTPAGWIASKVAGGKSWLHIQDFELDASYQVGLLKSGVLRKCAEFFERFMLRRFERISTISDRMLQKLEPKGARKENCVLIPNWVNTRLIFPLDRPSCFREELGLSESDHVLLYAGTMGEKQGLELMLDVACQYAHDTSIQFILCGEGIAKKRLMGMAVGMTNVRFLPTQPIERLNELLNLADVHLLIQRPEVSDSVMPSKLTGILAAGGAVIATVHNHTELFKVLEEVNGVVVEPGNCAALAECVQMLSREPERRREMGQSGRTFALKHFSPDAILEKLSTALLGAEVQQGLDSLA